MGLAVVSSSVDPVDLSSSFGSTCFRVLMKSSYVKFLGVLSGPNTGIGFIAGAIGRGFGVVKGLGTGNGLSDLYKISPNVITMTADKNDHFQHCDIVDAQDVYCRNCNAQLKSVMHCCHYIYGIRNIQRRKSEHKRVVDINSEYYENLLSCWGEDDPYDLDVYSTNTSGVGVYKIIEIDEEEEYENYINYLDLISSQHPESEEDEYDEY